MKAQRMFPSLRAAKQRYAEYYARPICEMWIMVGIRQFRIAPAMGRKGVRHRDPTPTEHLTLEVAA